jgi:hypothetical protein
MTQYWQFRELACAKLKNRVDVARDGQEAVDYLSADWRSSS